MGAQTELEHAIQLVAAFLVCSIVAALRSRERALHKPRRLLVSAKANADIR